MSYNRISIHKTKYVNNRLMFYELLVTECSSFNELKLRIMIYGITWHQVDWAMFFILLFRDVFMTKDNAKILFNDILNLFSDNTEESHEVAKIILDKLVFCGIEKAVTHDYMKTYAYNLFAKALKLYPSVWKMQWMWRKNRKNERCHMLKNSMPGHDSEYYMSDDYLKDFIEKYDL